jgi:hypothetical protein
MDFKTKQVILGMTFSKRMLMVSGIGLLLAIQACTPDDATDGDIPPPAPTFTYTAKLNGTNWLGKQNLSLLVKNSQGSPSKEMRISANSTDGKLLNLTLEDGSTGVAGDGIAIKTYTLSTVGNSDATFTLVDTQKGGTYVGAYGVVTITKSDATNKKLSGTFNCTLYVSKGDSMKVTNGIITDLPYTITEE